MAAGWARGGVIAPGRTLGFPFLLFYALDRAPLVFLAPIADERGNAHEGKHIAEEQAFHKAHGQRAGRVEQRDAQILRVNALEKGRHGHRRPICGIEEKIAQHEGHIQKAEAGGQHHRQYAKHLDGRGEQFKEQVIHIGNPAHQPEARVGKDLAVQNHALEQAQVPGADFTQMVALYNDDPYMTENIQGIVMTASQCENSPQFETVFELEEGEITGVLVGTDGYYIVKRLPLAVTYYDDNQEAILQEARDVQFNQLLEEWTEEASVRTTDIYKKMDFDNLWDYVE